MLHASRVFNRWLLRNNTVSFRSHMKSTIFIRKAVRHIKRNGIFFRSLLSHRNQIICAALILSLIRSFTWDASPTKQSRPFPVWLWPYDTMAENKNKTQIMMTHFVLHFIKWVMKANHSDSDSIELRIMPNLNQFWIDPFLPFIRILEFNFYGNFHSDFKWIDPAFVSPVDKCARFWIPLFWYYLYTLTYHAIIWLCSVLFHWWHHRATGQR